MEVIEPATWLIERLSQLTSRHGVCGRYAGAMGDGRKGTERRFMVAPVRRQV